MTSNSIRWDEYFAAVVRWNEAHGHLPGRPSTNHEELRLHNWLRDQKRKARSGILTAPRVAKLVSLDASMVTARSQDNQDLIDWALANGRPPRNSRNPDPVERSLCWRLTRLRSRHRQGKSRIGDLETLLAIPGSLLDSEHAAAQERLETLRRTAAEQEQSLTLLARQPVDPIRWEASFKDLDAWFTKHESLPRRRSEDPDELRIANWLNIQRTHSRKDSLSPEREAKLRTVPGALEPRARGLSDVTHANRLAAFHRDNGRLPDPQYEEDSPAAYSLARLRKLTSAGAISAEARSLAETVPAAVRTTPFRRLVTVEERLQQVREYLDEHGHLPSGQAGGLQQWIWKAQRGEASVSAQKSEHARTAVAKLVEGYPAAPRQKPGPKARPA